MVSKCANPLCSARFRYLHEGKIFRLETTGPADAFDSSSQKTEYFWLCKQCAQTLEVVFRNGEVTTQPRQAQASEGAGGGEAESKPHSRRRQQDRG